MSDPIEIVHPVLDRGDYCPICERWHAMTDTRREIFHFACRIYMMHNYGNHVIITNILPEGKAYRYILGVAYHPAWGHPVYHQLGVIWIGEDLQIVHSRTTTRKKLLKVLNIARLGEASYVPFLEE